MTIDERDYIILRQRVPMNTGEKRYSGFMILLFAVIAGMSFFGWRQAQPVATPRPASTVKPTNQSIRPERPERMQPNTQTFAVTTTPNVTTAKVDECAREKSALRELECRNRRDMANRSSTIQTIRIETRRPPN